MNDTINLLLVSDLHLEAGTYDLAAQIDRLRGAGERIDAVLLLGDIVEVAGGSPIFYAKGQVPEDIPAAFVPGNHDFYGGRLGPLLDRWRTQARHSHVRVLYNEEMVLSNPNGGRVMLLGSTLWSNLQSLGPVAEADLRHGINRQIDDFSCIHASNGSEWTSGKMIAQFEKAELFLRRGLSDAARGDGLRRVVATHFGPHRRSIAPQWDGYDICAYFCNHLPELVERADLWLHGHTHNQFEYQVGEDPTRGLVICHPRGYAGGSEDSQASSYEPRLVKIPVQRMAWPRALAA